MGLLKKISDFLLNNNPWTNVYGMARSLLALGTLLTLCFNDINLLFKTASGLPDCPICLDLTKIGIFCLFKPYSLNIARWIAIGILVLVISGWRPRITGILHWWIAFSLNSSSIVLDGGDQVANVLCLLLIPITLLDPRTSHWKNFDKTKVFNSYAVIFANATMLVIRFQVTVIYFHAAVGKFKVDEWIDGTALYYFMSDPLFGGTSSSVLQILKSPFIMTSLTWLTLVLEIALVFGLILPRSKRTYLFIPALIFHVAIMVTFGLVSFGCSMIAALILYLRPWDQYFRFGKLEILRQLKTKTL